MYCVWGDVEQISKADAPKVLLLFKKWFTRDFILLAINEQL